MAVGRTLKFTWHRAGGFDCGESEISLRCTQETLEAFNFIVTCLCSAVGVAAHDVGGRVLRAVTGSYNCTRSFQSWRPKSRHVPVPVLDVRGPFARAKLGDLEEGK